MRPTLLLLAAVALAGCGGDEDPKRAATPTPTAAVTGEHPGKKVWSAHGCGSCHTFEAAGSSGELGPNLDESEHVRDRGYVTASIVDPSAENRSSGYGTGMMPEDYDNRIAPPEMDAFVDFIATQAGRR